MRPIVAFLVVCLLSQVGLAQQIQPVRSILQKCFGPNCQQAANDFGYDKDGAKIISVGPVMDPVPTLAPALPEASAATSAANRRDFRRTFLQALKQAKASGSITDLQHARLIIASLRPAQLEKIEAFCHESAIQEGLATPAAVDWDAIIAFIEKLIPLIIQLIDLFS